MSEQKKAFRNPELVVYGDIRRITQNVGNMGAVGDGGAAPTHKTS
jgi:hypothetical protein